MTTTTTTTTTRDRGDRYGPMEWAQQATLRRTTPDFHPDMWPPNLGLYLTPVDYVIWPLIQKRVHDTTVHDIDKLQPATSSDACMARLEAVGD